MSPSGKLAYSSRPLHTEAGGHPDVSSWRPKPDNKKVKVKQQNTITLLKSKLTKCTQSLLFWYQDYIKKYAIQVIMTDILVELCILSLVVTSVNAILTHSVVITNQIHNFLASCFSQQIFKVYILIDSFMEIAIVPSNPFYTGPYLD